MNAFATLMQRHPLIFFHLVTAVAALLLGALILWGRKGTWNHRTLGWMWVTLMTGTVLSSAFIRDYRLPNLYGFTPIHGFTLYVAVMLPRALRYVPKTAHTMKMTSDRIRSPLGNASESEMDDVTR